jgi:hypothetical protein
VYEYCQITTENHLFALSYPHCIEDINAHIVGEGYDGENPLFINGETVIDLDEAERVIALSEGDRERNQSMDMTIGLKNNDSSILEMLLVDFKFRMPNPENFKQVNMKGKVAGSSNILGSSVNIRSEYIFIVQSNLVEQARSRLARMIPIIPTAYTAMSIDDLKAKFF